MKVQEVSINRKVKKLEGLRGTTCLDQQRTLTSTVPEKDETGHRRYDGHLFL